LGRFLNPDFYVWARFRPKAGAQSGEGAVILLPWNRVMASQAGEARRQRVRELRDAEFSPSIAPLPGQRTRTVGGAGPANDAHNYAEIIAQGKARLGRPVLTLNERLRILLVEHTLRKRAFDAKQAVAMRQPAHEPPSKKAKPGRVARMDRRPPADTVNEAAQLTGYANTTVGGVVLPFRRELKAGKSIGDALDTIGVAAARGNFQSKAMRVTPTEQLARELRAFVRQRRMNLQHVNATHVTAWLVGGSYLDGVERQADGSFEPRSHASAQRVVRQLLHSRWSAP